MLYILEHVFDRYNKWHLVIYGFVKEFQFLERWHGCVQLQVYLEQQGKVSGVMLYLFIHWKLCVYDSIMQGLHGKRDFHEILKKAWVDIYLGNMGNPWGLSHGVCC